VDGFLANVFGADSRLAACFRSLTFLSLGFLSPNDFFSPKVFLSPNDFLSASARLKLGFLSDVFPNSLFSTAFFSKGLLGVLGSLSRLGASVAPKSFLNGFLSLKGFLSPKDFFSPKDGLSLYGFLSPNDFRSLELLSPKDFFSPKGFLSPKDFLSPKLRFPPRDLDFLSSPH
jgi:hypothetical protein